MPPTSCQSRNFRNFEVYLVVAADLPAAGDRCCARLAARRSAARMFSGGVRR